MVLQKKTNVATCILAHIFIYQTLHTGCPLHIGKHLKTRVKCKVSVHTYTINCMFCYNGEKTLLMWKQQTTYKRHLSWMSFEVSFTISMWAKNIQSQTKTWNLQSSKKQNKKMKIDWFRFSFKVSQSPILVECRPTHQLLVQLIFIVQLFIYVTGCLSCIVISVWLHLLMGEGQCDAEPSPDSRQIMMSKQRR